MRAFSIMMLSTAALVLSSCSTWSSLWTEQSEAKVVHASSSLMHVIWSQDIDQRMPRSAVGFSSPIAVQTPEGERIVVGGQDQRVRIYNAKGSEVSRIALAAACESGALKLSNGLIVLGDLGGSLYGLDIHQAKVAWRVKLSSALIGTPIAVGDGFVVQTSNNQLYRFSNDGKKVWSYSGILGGLSMHLTPSPVVYKERIYAALSNGDVVALKAVSGSFIWKRQLLLSNKASVMSELKVPVAIPLLIPKEQSGQDEDVLLVSVFQGELSFLSVQDGSTLINRKLSLKSAPLLIDDQVLVADTSGAVSALNAGSGATIWKKKLTEGELTGPIVWQGNLWVADDQGAVYRLNQSGELLARIDLLGRIDRAPVATEHGVLVRNNLGTLYMLR